MATKKKLGSRKKKQITRDCWDLDHAWLYWLKERLPVYLKDAGRYIDLEYYKFVGYRGEILTQRELVIRMIKLINWLTSPEVDDWSDEYDKKYRELMHLWSISSRALWW